ncbi:MAG TPA: ABC transporter permease [Bryobacteraceae bacterium]|nr:ABC transporter permease [Bryobacteraceae bacterium]
MSSLRQDLVYSIRTLARSPGYTAAALLSVALGIGANTAIFTLTNAVFLNPLPVKDVSRVLELFTVDHATRSTVALLARTPVSWPNFQDIREQSDSFSGLAAFTPAAVTLTGFGRPSVENAFLVTAGYFDVLGVPALAGRTFRPDEDRRPGANAVVVLSTSLARRLFGSPEAAIGRSINLSKVSYEVIGVAPPRFRGTFTINPPDTMWIPLSMHSQVFNGPIEQLFNERRFRLLNTFGRLRPGVDERQALAGLKTIASRLEAAYPRDNHGRSFEVAPLAENTLGFIPRGQIRAAALALSAAVGFVLLIACANIANLSLARATRRSREMGIRVALGAARGRLVRQLLTEAETISVAGGLLGIAIGWLGAQLLWKFRPAFLQQNDLDIHLDLRVLAFTAGVSLVTGLLFGLAPVFRASLPDLTTVLNSGGRGNIEGGGRHRLRGLLVMAEMALAVVALIGAGLFIRSMQNAQNIDPGFATSNLCLFGFDLGSEQMPPERGRQFMRDVVEKVSAVPGVASVAIAASAPLGGNVLQTVFREGEPVESRGGVLADTLPVSPGWFETMRVPLLSGRLLNEFDRAGSRRVVVVSEAMARAVWPGQAALGRRFRLATAPELYEVVGVVKNTAVFNIGEPPQPRIYLPFDQAWQPVATVLVRTVSAPERTLPGVLAAAQSLDPDLALLQPQTMRDVIAQALWAPRMAAVLFTAFGLLGMALAVVGVYGVMAYTVLQRTSEVGIRMALGAPAASVLGMFVLQSARMALVGIAVGIFIAVAITRAVASLLFDVSPTDPVTFVAVAIGLALTALAAGAIPAWRAARIDPVRALREA